MNRQPQEGRRPMRKGEASRVITALEQHIRTKTQMLVEKYHVMYMGPVMLRLNWLERPWYERAWLKATGKKPDIDEERATALAAWDEQHLRRPCEAVRPDGGEQCELGQDHEGSHTAKRAVQLKGATPYVAWLEPEEEETP